MKKILLVIIAIIVILPIAYYLISPIFRVVEVQEESPLALQIKDSMDTMNAETKAEFQKQVKEASKKIMVMEDKMPSSPKIIAQGNFKPGAHDVEGKAFLIEDSNKKILRFEDFETINGPELHIYLSPEPGNDDFIDLGKIKATKGNVNYEISDEIDIDKYSKVLVWCKPFSVLFSYAELS